MIDLGFVHQFIRGTSPATLLLLHGTGGDEHDLLPLGRDLAPHATLLSPRGQVLEHGMPRFFRRLAAGVFDKADLLRRADDLAEFVDAAVRHHELDGSRVYALGYSNGANIAAALLLLHPRLLAGAALLRPLLPLDDAGPPDLAGKPILIAAGTQDPYSPRQRVEALSELLSLAGASVEVYWHAGGHELDPAELDVVRTWVERHVR